MTQASSPESPPVPAVASWAFWRTRLARMLVVGGLVLAATRVIPSLPEDQTVLFRAPDELRIDELSVEYRRAGDEEPLGGSRLQLTSAVARLPYIVRVPDGSYQFRVAAELRDPEGTVDYVQFESMTELGNGPAVIEVPAPRRD